jgi:hypothetical protein
MRRGQYGTVPEAKHVAKSVSMKYRDSVMPCGDRLVIEVPQLK